MTGKTHRVGGMLAALAGYTVLESKGMLLEDVNPVVQLVAMYPFAIYGSVFSDLDHHWQSSPSKDIFSYIVNKVLHLGTGIRKKTGTKNPLVAAFDAKHRSWQTHSDLFLILIVALAVYILHLGLGGSSNILVTLISVGFTLGVISHLVLDMITPEGIWCIGTSVLSNATNNKSIPKKIHLVPKTEFFATGGSWENGVRIVMWVACFVLLAGIIYSFIPYQISFS